MFNLFIPLAILATLGFIFKLDKKSPYLTLIYCLLQVSPFFALLYLFLSNETSYQYVWLYGGEDLPLRYRISAVWAAREGPLLLWVVFLSTLAIYYRQPTGKEDENNNKIRFTLVQGFILTILCIAQLLNQFIISEVDVPIMF